MSLVIGVSGWMLWGGQHAHVLPGQVEQLAIEINPIDDEDFDIHQGNFEAKSSCSWIEEDIYDVFVRVAHTVYSDSRSLSDLCFRA
ncbi:MAG: hypothetical protein ACR2PX_00695 [Endozoicomonas sp.]|uniref:hypothetical protein n=1 Tax=Endozoicomonas sp. TaxID=1892382 RepID=UPI003D9B1FF5